jgi:hypothetical protein
MSRSCRTNETANVTTEGNSAGRVRRFGIATLALAAFGSIAAAAVAPNVASAQANMAYGYRLVGPNTTQFIVDNQSDLDLKQVSVTDPENFEKGGPLPTNDTVIHAGQTVHYEVLSSRPGAPNRASEIVYDAGHIQADGTFQSLNKVVVGYTEYDDFNGNHPAKWIRYGSHTANDHDSLSARPVAPSQQSDDYKFQITA